jgi:hypothetical protein
MITLRESPPKIYIDFNNLESWESFERIISRLEKSFLVKVLNKYDGPESRVWKIQLNDVFVSIHNNPYGNYLLAELPDSVEYVKNIFPLLKQLFY